MKTTTKTALFRKKIILLLSAYFFIFPAFSKIYINEISGNDKWLEIYNSGTNEVDLTGYTIRKIDENSLPADWQIPSGTKIAAKGFLVWSAKSDGTGNPSWGISAKKDVAFKIFDSQNNEIDYFEVRSNLYSDGLSRTVGRETDGANKLVIFLNEGTKGATNNTGTKQAVTENPKKLFVNEMNGNDNDYYGVDQHKWLEIYNNENEAIDLTNYSIRKIDENGSVSNWFIPSGRTIEAKGFIVFEQDSLCTDGSTFTWGISAKKDVTFKIFDNNGTELDSFEVQGDDGDPLNSQGSGQTVGRQYDGFPTLVVFNHSTSTKGTSNGKAPSNALENVSKKELNVFVSGRTLFLSNDIEYITIYNVSGNKILFRNIEPGNNVDLSGFLNGIYLVKIKGNNKDKVQKILLKD